MVYKKGDRLNITTPALDKWTPAETDTVTVQAIYKSGKIKVWSDWGHGYTVGVNKFLEFGGTIERI